MPLITDKQGRALSIVAKGYNTPARFAEQMWPDSDAWRKSYNVGKNGATRGRGIVISGGSYLAKLAKAGLLRRCFETTSYTGRGGKLKHYYKHWYELSEKGRHELALWNDFA